MTTLEPTRILIEEGRATLPELHLTGGGTDVRMEGETSLAAAARGHRGARASARSTSRSSASSPPRCRGSRSEAWAPSTSRSRHGAGRHRARRRRRHRRAGASPRPDRASWCPTSPAKWRSAAAPSACASCAASLGGGTVEARASIDLRNLTTLESVVLEAEATEVNLEFGDGVRARFSGDALFQGRGDQYRLRGDLRILTGLFTRELDSATSETDFLAGVRAELVEEETAPFAETVELDLRLATAGRRPRRQPAHARAGGRHPARRRHAGAARAHRAHHQHRRGNAAPRDATCSTSRSPASRSRATRSSPPMSR